jgi:parallel beta-helix repeat protein
VISDNATNGMIATSSGITFNRVTAQRNGLLGLMSSYSDNLTLSKVRGVDNNTEHFNQAPVSGGVKIQRARGITVRDSVWTGNEGPGIWMDESVYDMVITGNDIRNNAGHGISLELSAKAVVADNVFSHNGREGLKINNTNDVKVWNNTFTNNSRTIWVAQDPRIATDLGTPGHDPRQKLPDPTVPWVITDVEISNNIFRYSRAGANCIVCVDDYTKKRTAEQMRVTLNGNAYNRVSSGQPKWVATLATAAGTRGSSRRCRPCGRPRVTRPSRSGSTAATSATPRRTAAATSGPRPNRCRRLSPGSSAARTVPSTWAPGGAEPHRPPNSGVPRLEPRNPAVLYLGIGHGAPPALAPGAAGLVVERPCPLALTGQQRRQVSSEG